ncbi:vWA domain-containing protein [Aliigemmobacter aestuarii]|nr:VWA domain-containing protein [Gemmobacter aestuarii]
MKQTLAAAIFTVATVATASAQTGEAPNTILVLDASGSMWGQIDGTAKIQIAQDVVGTLLDTLPDGQNLGLTVYGHRTRGDCTDIETVVPPGPGTREAIRAAVMAIKPRGKTPMTDAVVAAAEALKYTEEAATVILVSDGIETCNPDPCAAAAALEEAGVNFTAHVVGFDVAGDPQAQAQLQCLAGNTGGQYRGASNAAELAEALTQVVAAEPAEPVAPLPARLRVTVREGSKTGPQILDGIKVFLTAPESETDEDPAAIAEAGKELSPGQYAVSVLRIIDEATAEAAVELTDGESEEVILVLQPYRPGATLAAPDQADAGATIKVDWKGPGGDRDYLSVATSDQKDDKYINYVYTNRGNPGELVMPTQPGSYEIRYIWQSGNEDVVLATRPITVVAVAGGLSAPDEAVAGTTIKVDWTAGGYDRDYIAIAKPGAKGGEYVTYVYANRGNPAELKLPVDPGDYEVRYILGQDDTIFASRPIRVLEAKSLVSGPAEAKIGQVVEVAWEGPGADRDYISLAIPGSEPGDYVSYTYANRGNPLELELHSEPGTYEIRYIAAGDKEKILASQPVTLSGHVVALTAPASAPKATEITVAHTGPGYDRDYIAIAKAGEGGYVTYQYVRGEPQVKVRLPEEPGAYEVVYYLGRDEVPLATVPLTVE